MEIKFERVLQKSRFYKKLNANISHKSFKIKPHLSTRASIYMLNFIKANKI